MFINDIDVLNANINNALYRQHGAFNSTTTSTTNPLQPHQSSLDTALHLQSTANSLTFACQQKSSGFSKCQVQKLEKEPTNAGFIF